MKKFISLLAMLLILGASQAACNVMGEDGQAPEPATEDLLDRVLAANKLIVATDPVYPPQSFLNERGELDGFDVNVAQEVARRLEVELEFVTPEWDQVIRGNWLGQWDLSISSMAPTQTRSEFLWFTDPYYYTPAAFAVHKDNVTIKQPGDLAGKTIGVVAASTYQAYLEGNLSLIGEQVLYDSPRGISVTSYSTDVDAFRDLALGDGVRLNAVMSAQPTIQKAIERDAPLRYVGAPAFYEPLVFALDKSRGSSDKMLARLNAILAEMHADGSLTELSLKWYGTDLTAR
ncbi:MAG: transporter substrate-binding domain-containing protein [Chloroflexota bacterium]